MNINDDFSSPAEIPSNALEANELAMQAIWDTFVNPIGEENMTEEQGLALLISGVIFKDLAEKAHAYEQIQSGEFYKN